ncbi:MAG: xanthine dehydrogenase family protein molybdopterin-binding subunit [Nitrososphaerota archaeon]|nr:xanthine dehydrogenase family protein molybdopterin-binding subunit [Nitrososphaerota archaeon]
MSSNPNQKFALVGNPDVHRVDALTKITGQTRYTNDLQPPDVGVSPASGFVYMGYVTCPYPHAKIKKIDTSKAEAAGYVTLSAQDTAFLPEYTYYSTAGNRLRGPLPIDEVRYTGCPVVAVGASSPDLVTDAINLVEVEYDPLPYVFDAEGALAAGAPQLWPGGNAPGGAALEGVSTPSTAVVQIGDAAGAIAEADAVVTVRLDTQFIQHQEMEPRGLIAQWAGGNVYIWGNTQYAHAIVRTVANYFGIPVGNVTVRTSLGNIKGWGIGLGSGNKSSGEEYIIATALSKKAGSPVKFLHTRTTHASATSNRFPERAYITVAGKAGKITAFKAVVYANVGANGGASSDLGEFYVIYNVPNLDLTSYSANSNAFGLAGPQRDVGESQNSYFVEASVDMLAEKMNINPATFRLNNMRTAAYTDPATGTQYPNTAMDIHTGYPFSGYGQPGAHLKAVAAFNFAQRWKGWGVPSAVLTNSGETNGTGKKLRGIGISLTSGSKGALSPPNTGQIQVDPKGNITVFTGGTDHGGGWMTSSQIVAGELLGQTDFHRITLYASDTSVTTDTGVTAGSRMTRNGGMGLVKAAADLANQWFPIVAAKLAPGTKASNLAFGNNTIFDTTNPSNSMGFDAAAALLKAPIKGNGVNIPPPKTAYRVGGTKICEVEVDVETADVRVIDYVGGLGLGRVIFAQGADAQNQGGFIGHGIGEALYEEIIPDSSTGLNYSGRFLSPNYLDFKFPTIMQAPNRALSMWEEYVDPLGPFGAVGIGENVLMSVIPCILNALSNALGGYRFTKVPVRREDIVAALQWMKDNGKL